MCLGLNPKWHMCLKQQVKESFCVTLVGRCSTTHYNNFVIVDQPHEAVFSSDRVQHGEDGEWQRSTSTTSSQSEQAEKLLQNQHKSLASEDTKTKRAQKPTHMRRNIR